jgi:hypothetical protein
MTKYRAVTPIGINKNVLNIRREDIALGLSMISLPG